MLTVVDVEVGGLVMVVGVEVAAGVLVVGVVVIVWVGVVVRVGDKAGVTVAVCSGVPTLIVPGAHET